MLSIKAKKNIKNILSRIYPHSLFTNRKLIKAPIICYHSINDKDNLECDPLPRAIFEKHLQHLIKNYSVISLRQLVTDLRKGHSIASNSVVITFDDGYKDNYELALPLLEKYRCHATFFVVTDFIEGKVLLNDEIGFEAMSWDQVKALDKSPYADIGSHGKTHVRLSSLTDECLKKEIYESRFTLEKKLGRKIDLFAYPNGQGADIHHNARDVLTQHGFDASCTTFWRSYQTANNNFELNRVMIYGSDDQLDLEKKISGKFDFLYFIHKFNAFKAFFAGGRGIC